MSKSTKRSLDCDGVFRMRLPQELLEKMHKTAKANGMTMSGWIRHLAVENIKKEERKAGVA